MVLGGLEMTDALRDIMAEIHARLDDEKKRYESDPVYRAEVDAKELQRRIEKAIDNDNRCSRRYRACSEAYGPGGK